MSLSIKNRGGVHIAFPPAKRSNPVAWINPVGKSLSDENRDGAAAVAVCEEPGAAGPGGDPPLHARGSEADCVRGRGLWQPRAAGALSARRERENKWEESRKGARYYTGREGENESV